MDNLELLRSRKTVRGFLKKDISRKTITEILLDAHWAPSSSNQQPWQFHVLTGTPLKNLCARILAAHQDKKKEYDPSKGQSIPKHFVDRTRQLFKDIRPLISSLGEQNRNFIESGSYRFYDAPVVVFMNMHSALPQTRLMDMGMAAQNLMLSAHGRGLGTCAIALTLLYSDVIIQELNLPPEIKPVLCIALGYPNPEFPLNQFRSSRVDIEECVEWLGF